jgi:hypothetical protein
MLLLARAMASFLFEKKLLFALYMVILSGIILLRM